MSLHKNPPEDIYAFIEIPKGSNIKYEFEDGKLFVDRVLYTAMFYPYNYGYIPETLEEDGDPLDVLVIMEDPVLPGSYIRIKPIGVLIMEDEKGIDRKLIAVPHKKIDPRYENINDIDDLGEAVKLKIKHFFERYKELEPGKWVKVKGFEGKEKALEIVKKALENYKNKQ